MSYVTFHINLLAIGTQVNLEKLTWSGNHKENTNHKNKILQATKKIPQTTEETSRDKNMSSNNDTPQ